MSLENALAYQHVCKLGFICQIEIKKETNKINHKFFSDVSDTWQELWLYLIHYLKENGKKIQIEEYLFLWKQKIVLP